MSAIIEKDNKLCEEQNNNETITVNGHDEKRRTDFEKVRHGLAQVGSEGTKEQVVEFYNNNAVDYHKMSLLAEYHKLGCESLINALTELVPDKNARVLDLAAGSGLAGRTLRACGYENIDALEPAEQFIALARSENIYKKYIYELFTPDDETTIDNGTYDAICIMGSVQPGHISLDSLPEMKRISKSGGVLAFTIADKYLKLPEYDQAKLEKLFDTHVQDGMIQKWDKVRGPYRYEEGCNIYRITFS